MKKTLKTAKNKVISKKRGSKIAKVKTLGVAVSKESLIEKLGANFGRVVSTGKQKKNRFLAISADNLNRAFGHTQEEALSNLLSGISNRTI